MDRFLVDFGLQLGGPRGSNESGFRGQVGSRNHLGAQMAPRPHPSSMFGGSWSIFRRFGSNFVTILGRFWGRCWLIFVWLLMDNVTSLTNLTNLTNLTPGTVAGLARRASGYNENPIEKVDENPVRKIYENAVRKLTKILFKHLTKTRFTNLTQIWFKNRTKIRFKHLAKI